jgi:uncharacterized protein (DUF1810 family)
MNYDLNRFIIAQESCYEQVLTEMINGKKTSHWMWYIFPQIQGLGKSTTSIMYALNGKEEAISYLNHPILGIRLDDITKIIFALENKTAREILGSPDDLKLKSCMTLFYSIQAENNIFGAVLDKYFEGEQCHHTLRIINQR